MKKPSEIWSGLAELYEEKFKKLDIYNSSYDRFCRLLPHNAKILELGCGPGNITRYLLKQCPDFQILATDYAPGMIDWARGKNAKATFQVLDAKNLDNLSKTFDGIIAGFILPFFDENEIQILFKSLNERLHPNGKIYLSFVSGDYTHSHLKTSSSGDELFFHYYTIVQIQKALETKDFSVMDVMTINYPVPDNKFEQHVAIFAEKSSFT